MGRKSTKTEQLERRRMRGRKSVVGTPDRPRLSVRRSLKHIYAQVIDDSSGVTLASASSVAMKITGGNVSAATEVGKQLAQNALKSNVKAVRFDRNGRLYHGRVKALAEAARAAGLEF